MKNRSVSVLALSAVVLAGAPAAGAADGDPVARLFSRPALPGLFGVSHSELADVTSDGVADLVSSAGGGISVMRGREAGGFAPARLTPSSTPYADLLVARVDGDGRPDVLALVATPDGFVVEALMGTGEAVLGAPADAGLPQVRAIAAGSFPSDATVALATEEEIAYYRPGPGGLQEVAAIPATSPVLSLVAADPDADGLDELAVRSADGDVALYRGTQRLAGRSLPGFENLFAGDVTGDAGAEVLAPTQGRIVALSESLATIRDVPGADSVFGLATGDLDGDDRPDIARIGGDAIVDVHRAGGGSIEIGLGAEATDLLVHDATGDGRPDVLAVERTANIVEVVSGDGVGGFPPSRSVMQTGLYTDDLVLRDLDADGKADLVSSEFGVFPAETRFTHVYLGDGDGGFARKSTLSVDGQPGGLAVADVNADAKQDILVGDFQLGVSQFLGAGDGTFAPRTFMTICRLVVEVAAGDFNGDAYGDLAAVCRNSFNPEFVAIFAGSPAGLRPAGVALTLNGSDARGFRVGDLNGDQRLDIVVGHYDASINVAIQQADGTFTVLPEEQAPERFNDLEVGDLNGDGRADIVVPIPTRDEVWIRLSGPGGAAAGTSTVASYEYPSGAALGDLTGDGELDLVLGHGPNAISVTPGNGDGGFGDPWAFTGHGSFIRDVVVADVNKDGRLDVGAALNNGAEVFVQGR